MYYRIIPLHKTFDTYGLVYKIPENLRESIKIWQLAAISIGMSNTLWVCAGEVEEEEIPFDIKNVKDISDLQWDITFLNQKHIDLLVFVSEHYITPIHNAAWLFFPKNLQEKILKNTVEKIKKWSYSYKNPTVSLSAVQRDIYENICASEKPYHLIYGVTGSGKTQIYMKLIQDVLERWQQALLLIPEIILTSQIGGKIQSYFWDDVLILHSWVSAAKKASYWMDIHESRAKLIIGTRSSLFYPYKDLWIIIVDEEHDPSYVSDNAPRYNAIEVASKMSELYGCKLILWSGTPKITSFHKALWWDYQLHQMLEVYNK